jgi:hypothetical protein
MSIAVIFTEEILSQRTVYHVQNHLDDMGHYLVVLSQSNRYDQINLITCVEHYVMYQPNDREPKPSTEVERPHLRVHGPLA